MMVATSICLALTSDGIICQIVQLLMIASCPGALLLRNVLAANLHASTDQCDAFVQRFDKPSLRSDITAGSPISCTLSVRS